MASVVRSVRADEAEILAWVLLAAELGTSFNAWARRALNDQMELDRALLREADEEGER